MDDGAGPARFSMLVGQLGSESAAVQEQAVGALRNLAERDAETRKAIAIERGALSALVGLLRSDGAGVQEQAAGALATLAFQDDEIRKAIVVECGALNGLVGLLRSESAEVQEQAARALWNLAANNIENKKAIAAEGGALSALVGLLESESVGIQEQAAEVLACLARVSEIRKAIVAESCALSTLVGLLRSKSAGVQEQAAGALKDLAMDAEVRKAIAAEGGALSALVGLLRSESVRVQENAARVLWTLTADAENEKLIVAEGGALSTLVGLLGRESAGVQAQAAGALWNLVKIGKERERLRVNGGSTPPNCACFPRPAEVAREELTLQKAWTAVLDWATRASDEGNQITMLYRAWMLYTKPTRTVEDVAKARRLYELILEAPQIEPDVEPAALFNLGLLYAHGRGAEKNWSKAADYFRDAYEKASVLGDQGFLDIIGAALEAARRLMTVTETFKPVRILSIDGGGVRGILPAEILSKIEAEVLGGRPIHDCFDIIAGTSTGGIIAAMLSCPGEHGNYDIRPKFSAKDIAPFYKRMARKIFSSSMAYLRCFGFCCFPKHSAVPLEHELYDHLKGLTLENALVPLVIPAYDIDGDKPVVFSSLRPETKGHLLREVCRATSAAPTFFHPAVVDRRRYIDGGIYVNNPTMLAITHALEYREALAAKGRDRIQDLRNIFGFSLGTGTKPRGEERAPVAKDSVSSEPPERAKPAGYCFAAWLPYLVKASMKGSAEVVHDEVERLFKSFDCPQNYKRINIPLRRASKAMDLTSPEQLKALAEDAKEFLENVDNFSGDLYESQLGRLEPVQGLAAMALPKTSQGVQVNSR